MGHGKLKKFAENETFSCLLQASADEVLDKSGGGFALKRHPVSGNWNGQMFQSPGPIVLELGCGRGEYSIALAERLPQCNYIGVDIKGARLWKGAKYATVNALGNVAFLRTRIEFIEAFFAPGEISELWLTFSDPQLGNEKARLSSPRFLERYRKFLAPGALIHLKTDSRFLFEYTRAVCRANSFEVLAETTDLAASDPSSLFRSPSAVSAEKVSAIYEVKTYYERLFSAQGYKITYLCFRMESGPALVSPADFDADYWRSVEGPRHFARLPE